MSKNVLFKKLIKVPIYEAKITLIVAEDCRKVSLSLNGITVNAATSDFTAITYYGCGNHFGLLFDKKSANVNVIAHEVFHLTHRILDFVGANFDTEHHEQGALLNGYLMDTVIKELSSFTAKTSKKEINKMPLYIFESPSGEIKEIVQNMNEPHVYSENGVTWNRLYTVPQAASNSQLDPFSTNQFIEKTGKQKGKMRDLIDQSRELSERRKQIVGGEDPVQRKYFDEYQKNVGKKHMKDRPTVIETKDIKVDFTPPTRRRKR